MFRFVINYSDTISVLLPLVVYILLFHQIPKYYKPIFWYLMISFFLYTTSNILADKKINNLFIYHLLTVQQFILVFWFLKNRTDLSNTIGKIVILTFIFLAIINVCFFEKLNTLNANVIALEYLILIYMCFKFFLKISKTEEILQFYNDPDFIIIAGFFIYYVSSFLITSFYKYIASINREVLFDFWNFERIMFAFENIIIVYGLICYKKNSKK